MTTTNVSADAIAAGLIGPNARLTPDDQVSLAGGLSAASVLPNKIFDLLSGGLTTLQIVSSLFFTLVLNSKSYVIASVNGLVIFTFDIIAGGLSGVGKTVSGLTFAAICSTIGTGASYAGDIIEKAAGIPAMARYSAVSFAANAVAACIAAIDYVSETAQAIASKFSGNAGFGMGPGEPRRWASWHKTWRKKTGRM